MRLLSQMLLGILALAPTSRAQSANIHAGEEIFTISVRGGAGMAFKGSYLVTRVDEDSKLTDVTGTAAAEFKVTGKAVYLSFQNESKASDPEIRLDSDGKRVLDT